MIRQMYFHFFQSRSLEDNQRGYEFISLKKDSILW
jgi:hypothetical protein